MANETSTFPGPRDSSPRTVATIVVGYCPSNKDGSVKGLSTNFPDQIFLTAENAIKIGRDPVLNDYWVDDYWVTRSHLEFYAVLWDSPEKSLPPAVYVRDCGSVNGTYVNDEYRLKGSSQNSARLLRDGDYVRMFGAKFQWILKIIQPETSSQNDRAFNTLVEAELKVLNKRLNYHISRRSLGSGRFGVINLAVNMATKEQVACKIITRRHGNNGRILQEIDALRQVDHPNVMSFRMAAFSPQRVYLITKLATGGDLFSYMAQVPLIGEFDVRLIMRQIVRGVQYLHGMGILHRDLKPENILFATHPSPKSRIIVADFGSVGNTNLPRRLMTMVGTHGYNAPEVTPEKLRDSDETQHTMSGDMWAIGVVSLCLLWPPMTQKLNKINKQPQGDLDLAIRPVFHETQLSNDGQRFIASCLRVDPEHRMSAKTALRHDWFHRPLEDVHEFKAIDRRVYSGWRPRKALVPMAEEISETDVQMMLKERQDETGVAAVVFSEKHQVKNMDGNGISPKDVPTMFPTSKDEDTDGPSIKRQCIRVNPGQR